MAEISDLHAQLKARETNRLRAAHTLASEIYQASRGRGKISPEAFQGFITSWLFPHAVIVLGSVLGSLLLGVQTYILWSQTKLMAAQSATAQVERAELLRNRYMVTQGYLAEIEGFGRRSNPYSFKRIRYVEESVCADIQCQRTPLLSLVSALGDERFMTSENIRDPVAVAADMFRETIDALSETSYGDGSPEKMESPRRRKILDDASLQCAERAIDGDRLVVMFELLDGLVGISREAKRSFVRAGYAREFRDEIWQMERKLLSLDDATCGDGISFIPGEEDVCHVEEPSLGSFLRIANTVSESVDGALSGLTRACKQLSARDFDALRQTYQTD